MGNVLKPAFAAACLAITLCAPGRALALEEPATTVTVGVPIFSAGINLALSDHPVARFVRSAAGGSLVAAHLQSSTKDPPYRLYWADRLSLETDSASVSLRLRSDARFTNGEEVAEADISFSLQHCQDRNVLTAFTQIDVQKKNVLDGLDEVWVRLKPLEQASPPPLEQLAACPIYSKRAAELFGRDFGQGTNLVGAGKYNIVRFYNEKQIELWRISSIRQDKYLPAALVLRSFSDGRHGLTALRMGSIDAFVTADTALLKLAGEDPSVSRSQCFGLGLIKRKGLHLECGSELIVERIGYEG